MRFEDLSVLDLYFLARLMGTAIGPYEDVLTPRLKAFWGDDWKAKHTAAGDAYRASVDKLIKEITEASSASTEMEAFQKRVSAWREYMVSLVRQVEDERKQKHLLRVVGYGLGSPRSSKALKDLLQTVSKSVVAAKADLVALGASEDDVSFPSQAMEAEEVASNKLMSERADVTVARAAMRERFDLLVKMMRSIGLGADAARSHALLKEDKAALARVDELQARIDNAVSEARVQSRARAADPTTPAEVVTPVEPVEPAELTDNG